ncbi:MAG: 5-methyltetrahydropteroyltriglutamate--homocysteine S-methyltransferase [Candidatus Dormibacteria bacterium]
MPPSSNGLLIASTLGFPRIGPARELKWALEGFWSGRLTAAELTARAAGLRAARWELQRRAGIQHIPSNDFSLYDHVLDTALMVGAVPTRFQGLGQGDELELLFAMARGAVSAGGEVPPLDMTKWFDTNYHYLVPELAPTQEFKLNSRKPVEEFLEALKLGIETRPVLLGPLSFLRLSKMTEVGVSPLALLDRLLPVYAEALGSLRDAGAKWVQMDEPCLAQDAPVEVLEGLESAYGYLGQRVPGLRILVASYFASLGANLEAALMLPVDALHLDLVRGGQDLERALELVPDGMSLSLGVVDGRNVWSLDPDPALVAIHRAAAKLGPDRLLVAPSCSLLHVPVTVTGEDELDPEVRSWLAFAEQKLAEVSLLARSLNPAFEQDPDLARLRALASSRRDSQRRVNPQVRQRLRQVVAQDLRRAGDAATRRAEWMADASMPPLPTTTIGSFPQRTELRQARTRLRRGEIDEAAYQAQMEEEIRRVIRFQEEVGLDVLVHGEPERNDMVEYFAEQLEGVATTKLGWVQSYGSRCAKPPIIVGDVSRRAPMTVRWASFAQSLTTRPVKGMLTGPVTILQWSFPREDVPRSETSFQIGLALRDEVADLESAGIRVIQIDEPAFKEAMPLRREEQAAYLRWAIDSFKLAAGGAGRGVQIHTHMCYSEFGDIIEAIAELDADVLYIEAARSGMDLLKAFADVGYPNEVGPGVYDIHSPLVPSQAEMAERLRAAAKVIPLERLWANPDCGLKTRGWAEVEPSLRNLVGAARQVASELQPILAS